MRLIVLVHQQVVFTKSYTDLSMDVPGFTLKINRGYNSTSSQYNIKIPFWSIGPSGGGKIYNDSEKNFNQCSWWINNAT